MVPQSLESSEPERIPRVKDRSINIATLPGKLSYFQSKREYDQEMPQSQTADKPIASTKRDIQQQQIKATSSLLPS